MSFTQELKIRVALVQKTILQIGYFRLPIFFNSWAAFQSLISVLGLLLLGYSLGFSLFQSGTFIFLFALLFKSMPGLSNLAKTGK